MAADLTLEILNTKITVRLGPPRPRRPLTFVQPCPMSVTPLEADLTEIILLTTFYGRERHGCRQSIPERHGTRGRDHITPILRQLHWLPVRQRIQFKLVHVSFQNLHGSVPRTSWSQ